jgi:hypothetical protein
MGYRKQQGTSTSTRKLFSLVAFLCDSGCRANDVDESYEIVLYESMLIGPVSGCAAGLFHGGSVPAIARRSGATGNERL